jgi:hypothetical protein
VVFFGAAPFVQPCRKNIYFRGTKGACTKSGAKKQAPPAATGLQSGRLLNYLVGHDPLPVRNTTDQRTDRDELLMAGIGAWLQTAGEMTK